MGCLESQSVKIVVELMGLELIGWPVWAATLPMVMGRPRSIIEQGAPMVMVCDQVNSIAFGIEAA